MIDAALENDGRVAFCRRLGRRSPDVFFSPTRFKQEEAKHTQKNKRNCFLAVFKGGTLLVLGKKTTIRERRRSARRAEKNNNNELSRSLSSQRCSSADASLSAKATVPLHGGADATRAPTSRWPPPACARAERSAAQASPRRRRAFL
jgi:hypothetical protein